MGLRVGLEWSKRGVGGGARMGLGVSGSCWAGGRAWGLWGRSGLMGGAPMPCSNLFLSLPQPCPPGGP